MDKNTPEKEEKSTIAQNEEGLLDFWRSQHIFEKSLAQNEGKEHFVFYDGPPFATGLPHYGHILASVIKDAIPRYQTMRGKYVRRVWGWDCHGLPVETLIEKELGLEHKKDIEEYGIGKFNEAAQGSVLRYDKEWKKTIPRIGRWIDMENGYKTMDAPYTESVWWAFKELHEKGLVYKGFRSMHICPRCETTLSTSEVADGYQDVTDLSVIAKFELVGEPGTYVLAWTTTPWTLPGNVALAVGEGIQYVKVSFEEQTYIVAKERVGEVFNDKKYTELETLTGKDLVGKAYKPVFDYFVDTDIENKENGWKIYSADFVTTESGTGIVHIAPAFGEDDMELGKRENLPFIQHVTFDGKFTNDVKDFAERYVKPKDNVQETDIEIIKYLAHKNLLFSKEKITHSYPHCWRCDTPLLNYATSSWFIKVSAMRDKLLEKNKDVNWIPDYLKDGRFGNWLENARDWSISRTRFWGAPLPVWSCEKCDNVQIVGSIDEIAKPLSHNNTYTLMRHGESESNVTKIVSSKVGNQHALTDKGRDEAKEAAALLKEKGITKIYASDYMRTQQTAEIVAEELGLDKNTVIFDERLREVNTGIFDSKPVGDYHAYFANIAEKFTKTPPEGENLADLKRRMMEAIFAIEKENNNEHILIITHEYPAWMLVSGVEMWSREKTIAVKEGVDDFIKTAEVRELPFVPFPHNDNYDVDLHRPYIDTVELPCACGGSMKRIPDVFDCWVESGSMPFAQFHYPFENKDTFEKNFPADFIAEGLDQTRGWFYTLLVISTGLFDKAPYKNVISNGLIQAEDGRKMSKKLKNYPEPDAVLNRYGADALRYYLLSSPVVRAEELRFSEQGVDEVTKKVIMRFLNVVSFYEMYKDAGKEVAGESSNVLDKWILSRLAELIASIEASLEKYELDRATRPIADFVDDLSTWYIRRSRDRFKGDDEEDKAHALATTRHVLEEFSKAIAPFMPFIAESVYQKVKTEAGKDSVHLESWPVVGEMDTKVLEDMEETRRIVSLGLEWRSAKNIKVRQPLQTVMLNYEPNLSDGFQVLIKEELNVKDIKANIELVNEIELDTNITPELKKEGLARELIRRIQEMRKKADLTPNDAITITVEANDEVKDIIETHKQEIAKTALITNIEYASVAGDEHAIELEKGIDLKLTINR